MEAKRREQVWMRQSTLLAKLWEASKKLIWTMHRLIPERLTTVGEGPMPEMQLNQDGSIVPAAGGESMLLNMCHKLDAARSQLEEAEEHGVADVFSAHARYLAAGRPGGLNHNILNQLRSEAERVSALVPGVSKAYHGEADLPDGAAGPLCVMETQDVHLLIRVLEGARREILETSMMACGDKDKLLPLALERILTLQASGCTTSHSSQPKYHRLNEELVRLKAHRSFLNQRMGSFKHERSQSMARSARSAKEKKLQEVWDNQGVTNWATRPPPTRPQSAFTSLTEREEADGFANSLYETARTNKPGFPNTRRVFFGHAPSPPMPMLDDPVQSPPKSPKKESASEGSGASPRRGARGAAASSETTNPLLAQISHRSADQPEQASPGTSLGDDESPRGRPVQKLSQCGASKLDLEFGAHTLYPRPSSAVTERRPMSAHMKPNLHGQVTNVVINRRGETVNGDIPPRPISAISRPGQSVTSRPPSAVRRPGNVASRPTSAKPAVWSSSARPQSAVSKQPRPQSAHDFVNSPMRVATISDHANRRHGLGSSALVNDLQERY